MKKLREGTFIRVGGKDGPRALVVRHEFGLVTLFNGVREHTVPESDVAYRLSLPPESPYAWIVEK